MSLRSGNLSLHSFRFKCHSSICLSKSMSRQLLKKSQETLAKTTVLRLRNSTGPSVNTIQQRQYHENVIDHYENPRNVGSLDKADKDVGTGLVGAPACGDVMKLQIKVDENGRIVDSKFKTFGCGSAIASSSVATEWLKGRTVDECISIKNTDIASHLKLPPVKLHCSMLAEDAIKAAINDYKQKQNQ
uniref:Iron-sulfur cluster assembly protein n=1 Tax=Albugo laibachii Nc14 TaxID=890382 RepID=F0WFU8_9STRA|nr:iron sulfur cluster assembly protein 1 putative [Albugo laibachii Nc14]|eukprot:CCA20082.1 iron sulfur cluster assembly protein 1 putative [Albugo laibachii Nc14]